MTKSKLTSSADLNLQSLFSKKRRGLGLVERDRLVVRDRLTADDLIALMRGQLLAVRIKNYFPSQRCNELAECLLGSRLYGVYANAPEVGKVGTAFFECQVDEKIRQSYEANGVEWIRELRERAFPNLTPFDRFRLELDEAWLAGAHVATFNRKKAFAGLVRHFISGAEAEPHLDVLAWDDHRVAAETGIIGQLAWNCYLCVPNKGGELTLWGLPLTRDEYAALQIQGSYGVRRELLPEPLEVILPEVGEAIIFNAGFLHAVERNEDGSRVTQSCFTGYHDIHDPQLIWS